MKTIDLIKNTNMLYGLGIPDDVRELAASNKDIILYGYSDDLIEIDGYLYDEIDVWNKLNNNRVLDKASHVCNINGIYVEVLYDFNKPIFNWDYKLNIPFEKFDITHNGEVVNHGIVFNMEIYPIEPFDIYLIDVETSDKHIKYMSEVELFNLTQTSGQRLTTNEFEELINSDEINMKNYYIKFKRKVVKI